MATVIFPYIGAGETSNEMPRAKAGSKSVLICGSARCLWDDITKLGPFDGDLMAINYAGMFLHKRPQHWVSIHAECFQWMLPLMPDNVYSPQGVMVRRIETHSHRACRGVIHVWPKIVVRPGNGSSSLAGIRVALAMGYEQAILAGIPLDGSGHFYDPPAGLQTDPDYDFRYDYASYLAPWVSAARDEFNGRVKSLSGKTRELLGAP